MSPKSEMYHRSNVSSFSQSTPEKSNASGLDCDSSPDCFELTKTKLYQINKNYSKFSSRSHSESSLNNLKKNISILPFDTNMDISSDISLHYSHDQSLRELSGLGKVFIHVFYHLGLPKGPWRYILILHFDIKLI